MSDEPQTATPEFAFPPKEILFASYEAYKRIKDLVLVDEYGAFRLLDKDEWNQLDELAEEGFKLSSRNWGFLLSKVAVFQEKEQEKDQQFELTELVKAMETDLKGAKAQYGLLLRAKESLAVSLERLLAELTHFSIPTESKKPEDPDFTLPEKGTNLWLEALKATIGLRSRSLLTRFLVRYNQKHRRSRILFDKLTNIQEAGQEDTIKRMKSVLLGVETFRDEKELIGPFQEEVEAFELELEEYHRKIYKMAKEEHTTPEFTELLQGFLEWLIEQIPNFAETQVKIYFLQQLLYRQRNKAAAKRIGRVAAEAGDIHREALSGFAAAMVLQVHALGVPLSGSKAQLFDFPAAYPFHRSIPDGKLAEVAELGEQPADKLIELRGFVKAMETFRDSDGKLISRLILEEYRGGPLLAAEAIFLNLRNEGIAPGAYCHVQAYVRDPISFEGSDIPRLLIDRLSIKTELIARSWKVAFLDLSYPYFERWPNGVNLKCSLSPHHPDSDMANHKLGAAELGFKAMVN